MNNSVSERTAIDGVSMKNRFYEEILINHFDNRFVRAQGEHGPVSIMRAMTEWSWCCVAVKKKKKKKRC